jgi:hypothetical protein
MALSTGVKNHSPNASKIQAGRVFFSPLTDSSSHDPELFSDLASEHF